MTNKVVRLDDYRPHLTTLLVCLECKTPWLAIHPNTAKRLECPVCNTYNYLNIVKIK